MASLIMRFEQWGKVLAFEVDNPPRHCPDCGLPKNSFDWDVVASKDAVGVWVLLDGTRLSKTIDYAQLADMNRPIVIDLLCGSGHQVMRTSARLSYWSDLRPDQSRESPEVAQIVDIWGKLQAVMVPGLEYPSIALLERSFLPGQLIAPDVWISDKARISSRATLIGPLLIECRTVIEDGAICGPCAIIVNSVIPARKTVSGVVLIDNRVVHFAATSPPSTP